ncbi:MAG TPA: FkbM family methyltransferase [Vicinamibacterales bacterium]|nr:FkbM family methyltransferase [Vicinamibacterales bacterium]
MNPTLKFMRRAASAIKRQLTPTPEFAAWQHAEAMASMVPRRTPGHIRLLDYDIEYADLVSFCPQFHEIFVDRGLEFHTANRSPRILDCGSNVGAASLFFKRQYPDARITAYEADPELSAMTRRNLERNGAADVDVVHAALWTANGTVTFLAEGSDSGMIGGLAGSLEGFAAKTLTVPSLRLRDVLADDHVDLLKLDIEGAEGDVLKDCEPVLDRVSAIVMDLHEFDPNDRQSSRVFDCLARAGFVYSVDDLLPQHWRPPVAAAGAPFPGLPLIWTMTVRAWRA